MNTSRISFLNVYNPTEEELSSPSGNGSAESSEGNPRLSLRRTEGDFIPSYHVDQFFWPSECLDLQSSIREPLEKISAGIDISLRQNRRIIGFMSGTPGAGSTTLILATACFWSRRNVRILLADANYRRPQLASLLNMDPEFGWEAVLQKKIPMEDAVIEAGEGNVNLLPWLTPVSHDPEAANDWFPKIGATLERPRDKFDLILVDCPVTDPARVQWLESIIYVRDLRVPSSEESQTFHRFCQKCDQQNIPVLGTIENFAQ